MIIIILSVQNNFRKFTNQKQILVCTKHKGIHKRNTHIHNLFSLEKRRIKTSTSKLFLWAPDSQRSNASVHTALARHEAV